MAWTLGNFSGSLLPVVSPGASLQGRVRYPDGLEGQGQPDLWVESSRPAAFWPRATFWLCHLL